MSAPRGDPFQFMDRHKAGGAGGAGGGGGGGSTSSPMSIPARGAASSSGADFASLSVSLPPVSEGGRRRRGISFMEPQQPTAPMAIPSSRRERGREAGAASGSADSLLSSSAESRTSAIPLKSPTSPVNASDVSPFCPSSLPSALHPDAFSKQSRLSGWSASGDAEERARRFMKEAGSLAKQPSDISIRERPSLRKSPPAAEHSYASPGRSNLTFQLSGSMPTPSPLLPDEEIIVATPLLPLSSPKNTFTVPSPSITPPSSADSSIPAANPGVSTSPMAALVPTPAPAKATAPTQSEVPQSKSQAKKAIKAARKKEQILLRKSETGVPSGPTQQQGAAAAAGRGEPRGKRPQLHNSQLPLHRQQMQPGIGSGRGDRLPVPASAQNQQASKRPSKPLQYDDHKRVAKAARNVILSFPQSEKQVALFSHLQQVDRRQIDRGIGVAPKIPLHPSIIRLGLRYADRSISGSNARCLELLLALKDVIRDFSLSDRNSVYSQQLGTHIRPFIQFLTEIRPLSITMGNAITWLKKHISELDISLPESKARNLLLDAIDRYIDRRIVYADEVLSTVHGIKQICDGDVILTYAISHVVEMTLLYAKSIVCFKSTTKKKLFFFLPSFFIFHFFFSREQILV